MFNITSKAYKISAGLVCGKRGLRLSRLRQKCSKNILTVSTRGSDVATSNWRNEQNFYIHFWKTFDHYFVFFFISSDTCDFVCFYPNLWTFLLLFFIKFSFSCYFVKVAGSPSIAFSVIIIIIQLLLWNSFFIYFFHFQVT